MANLFDGLRQADSEILKMQIAMLQEVKLSNIREVISQKAKRKTIKAANYVTKIIAKKQFNEPQVLELNNRVNKTIANLHNLGKDELINHLKVILDKRLRDVGENLRNNMSEDELAVAIINCSSRHFKNSLSRMTPAQKFDVIRHRFNEELVFKLHKELAKQEYNDAKKLEALLQEFIDKFNDEEKENYKETINSNNLTGVFARNIFVTSDGQKLLLKVLDNVEKGKHSAFKSIMREVFLDVLGIYIPFNVKNTNNVRLYIQKYSEWISFIGIDRIMSKNGENKLLQEMLLEIIWLAGECYGRCYTPYLDELAIWIDDDNKRCEMIDKTKKIMDNIRKIDKHEKSFVDEKADYVQEYDVLKANDKEIAILKQKKREANMKTLAKHNELNELEERLKNLQERYIKATNDIDRIARVSTVNEEDRKEYDNIRAEYDYARENVKRKKLEIEEENAKAVEALTEINKKQIEVKDLKLRVEKRQEEIKIFEAQTSDLKYELDVDIESMKDWLNEMWHKRYERFEFGRNVALDVVKNLEYDEMCDVESVFLEIYNSKDPYSMRISRSGMGKQKGEMVKFLTLYGREITLYYKAVERDEDELKNVYITEITIKKET